MRIVCFLCLSMINFVIVVLPSGGKVVRLEDLEASQLSPVNKQPPIPGASSTPADTTVLSSSTVITRDSSSASADTRRRPLAPPSGPSHAHVPPGPAPALPAGAQTLEEIEAGLQNMSMPSTFSVNNVNTSDSATGGDLTAFNKLLHLVNKSQPVNDQVCILCLLYTGV